MICFKCDNCGEVYEVDSKHAGKTTKCAKCKSPITIPISARASSSRHSIEIAPSAPRNRNQPVAVEPNIPSVQVTVDRDKPSGLQGFFRAFGITSGFMAAITAVILGIPILACGGCLVSMIGIGATVQTPPRSNLSNGGVIAATEHSPDSSSSENVVALEPESPPPEPVVIQTLPKVDLSGRLNTYVFDGLTAAINDRYINDVRIVDLKGRPMTADVLLENNSGKDWKPSLRLEFVNDYGVVLGTNSINWALTVMEPRKRYTESIRMYPNRFDDIFRYSPITRPADFDEPKYLILHY